ncbi:MAG TPA: SDR family NAD(P)-dependent oxidoreductase [Miltoncostaeaceae bacterium]|nr:SDR family NAD(P)-dependent oxidoreductase [Miltoncostaeaceae bacterium]
MSPPPAPRPAALVTGASSGLGRAYAESLAARGHPLLLVARREDRLRELAGWAERTHGVAARVLAADLAAEDGLAACRDAIDAGPPLGLAILNAGFGDHAPVHGADRERLAAMVRLNCVAVVDLAAHVLPGMVARGAGAVVVVSSAAAWQPVPFMATYAATKAFELHLTEAVAAELRGTGVRALAVCPGPTRTEFGLHTGAAGTHWAVPFDDVDLVVRATWRALAAGRPRAATGLVARGSMLASRLLPRALIVRGAALTHRMSVR